MLGFEIHALEFHHHIAFETGVVEKQVDKKFVAADLKPELAAYKGEACAQFQQKPVMCRMRAFSISRSWASSPRPRKSKR